MSIDDRQSNASYISFRLAQVGGRFDIRAYDYLLSPNGQRHWERAVSHTKPEGDVIEAPPMSWIVQHFPKVVPQSESIPSHPSGDEHVLAERWRKWIAENRDRLSLLQPTGEAVDYSTTACQGGKPRETHGR